MRSSTPVLARCNGWGLTIARRRARFSSVVAFLYPGYASYKTLSQRPASEEDLERWLMYWSVLGCVVGVEYVAEWLVSW